MIKDSKDKMIGNENQNEGKGTFHFSGAGSNLPPVNIKANSMGEAEQKWRKMNDEAGQINKTGSYEDKEKKL